MGLRPSCLVQPEELTHLPLSPHSRQEKHLGGSESSLASGLLQPVASGGSAPKHLTGSLAVPGTDRLHNCFPWGQEGTRPRRVVAPVCHPPSPGQTLPHPLVFPFRRSRPNLSQTELIYFSCGLALGGAREQHVITLSKYYSSAEN